MARRVAIPYLLAIQWIVDNDDNVYLRELRDAVESGEDRPSPLLTVAFCADIYGRATEEVEIDLVNLMKKETSNAG